MTDDNARSGDHYYHPPPVPAAPIAPPKRSLRTVLLLTAAPLLLAATFIGGSADSKKNFFSFLSDASNDSHTSLSSPPLSPAAEAQKHPSYEILSHETIPELNSDATTYVHKKTGAKILSLRSTTLTATSNDFEKAFSITFRTPPSDSTGVAHIMEHSTLCGSRRYKTKEPFVDLLRGSLRTFLNAMTFSDRTTYLFSTRNEKDFLNSARVYLDAVFFPRAVTDEFVLRQEGWRLEPATEEEDEGGMEEGEDGTTEEEGELVYRGVVLNEMRGVFSDPISTVSRLSQNMLFPDTTYQHVSGGDPAVIPTLTFADFTSFHERFYHPTNSKVVLTNLNDVTGFLDVLDAEYLDEFERDDEKESGSRVAYQEKVFTEGKRETRRYAAGDDGEGHIVFLGWLLNDAPLSLKEELALEILEHLLVGTHSSVLSKALLGSGMGKSMVLAGIDDGLLQSTFSVGLRGVEKDDVEAVERLVYDTLETVARDGFSADDVASSLNSIEFRLRDPSSGDPLEISYMIDAVGKWIYDRDPTEGLKYEDTLRSLKEDVETNGSQIFQKLVKELINENNHRVFMNFIPSTTLEAEQREDEKDRIAALTSKLSEKERQDIYATAKELKKRQAAEDSPEAKATIPRLAISDLDASSASGEYPRSVEKHGSGATLATHSFPSTSGIAYIDVGIDLSPLKYEDVTLLPLYERLMKEAGTTSKSDAELSNEIGRHTGGVRTDLLINAIKYDNSDDNVAFSNDNFVTMLFLRGRATPEKVDKLLSIMKEMLTETKLDAKKESIEILKDQVSSMESSIQSSGNSYAYRRLKARYGAANAVNEKINGISALLDKRKLLRQAQDSFDQVKLRLEDMRNTMFSNNWRSGMIINLTGDDKILQQITPSVDHFIDSLPGTKDAQNLANDRLMNILNLRQNTNNDENSDAEQQRLSLLHTESHPWVAASTNSRIPVHDEGFIVSTKVSYVGKGGPLYAPGETISGAASVVEHYIKEGYLWDTVRVIGGAYGGSCQLDGNDGFFAFVSYRDPNVRKTLAAYDDTVSVIRDKIVKDLRDDPALLTPAIIGSVGSLDGKVLRPVDKGWVSLNRYLVGKGPEGRQKWRKEVLAASVEDFEEFAKRLEGWNASVAVVSSGAALEAEGGDQMTLLDLNDDSL